MRLPALFILVSVLAVIALCTFAIAAENTEDSLETVKENVDEEVAVLVDVREKSEWDEGHIEGSILLALSTLKKGIKKEKLEKSLPEDRILYTFCVVGKRSVTAAQILEEYGYEVRALKPGYKELLKAGFKKAEKKE